MAKAFLMDAYRMGDEIVLWLKTPDDIRIVRPYQMYIYMAMEGEGFLRREDIKYRIVKRTTYLRKEKKVLKIPVPRLSSFERFVSQIEKATRHRVPLYDADIKPEQMFLYENDLRPFSPVLVADRKIIPICADEIVPLSTLDVTVIPDGDIYLDPDVVVREIIIGEKSIRGDEKRVLEEFVNAFMHADPDVVMMDYAYSRLPYLYSRLARFSMDCPFHRWDIAPLKYRGGRSYWTYGQVRYQDYAVRLHGRFLVDNATFVGTESDIGGIAELANMSGTLFQVTASRSFGSAFQMSLVRLMVRRGFLVPHKEKPIDEPLSMLHMLKADRAGHTFDPKVGFNKDVAEIDFTSMFPWLIYNHNISADCILSDTGPFENIPGVPVRTTLAYKGLIPLALKPFIDRRMYYKKNPTAINKARSKALKWLLVSCYGYLRFREFKLGIPTSHMAICAYARETLLKSIRLAEERGFEVVHGIVDSLYIKKKGITEGEVASFCQELEQMTGIPITCDGIFRWVVFLPSVVDKDRALPSTYYGVYRHGEIKARGIELRQRSAPGIVRLFQRMSIEMMKGCTSRQEIRSKVPSICRSLRDLVHGINSLDRNLLVINVRISKTEYKHSIPQKEIVRRLQEKGVRLMPGQFVHFIFQRDGVVFPEDYDGKPDVQRYRSLLIRSLFVILQPFGFTRELLAEYCGFERQLQVTDFIPIPKLIQRYVHVRKAYAVKRGLSERLIKDKLEREGWKTWRGGLIGILDQDELYPNVRRKYLKLKELLDDKCQGVAEELKYINSVHHGMPDFICYQNSEFKFVECKQQYEPLSRLQRKCIARLHQLGFTVDVYRIVDYRTKTRLAELELSTGKKRILERQLTIRQAGQAP